MKVALYLSGIFHCERVDGPQSTVLISRPCGGDFVEAYLQIFAHLRSVFLEAGMSRGRMHLLCSENFKYKAK